MQKFLLVITCAECGKEYAQGKETEEEYFFLNIDFKTGNINFMCPECKKLNKIEFINQDNVMKGFKLPKGRVWRG